MVTTDWKVWDRHMWMTRMQVSLAIERQINLGSWDSLVNHMIDLQSFDRDPAGWLNENGEDDTYKTRTTTRWNLQDAVSSAIDNCYNNSGA